ncbi:hypothetical protein A2962_03550 [Candidatus Woesebacteria bacterium RIFCSPLOWO2_01_FULL_39_61]|uniref:Uncharacterized protein n=1 Tax=Candidatus Woesebacteria bacterium RIFCSPHIGHO2_02_FULL_39_13 TaxID=1802505 RepID=A0A1F7Z384_9BACT|nr:MAG: hypothetical protein A2692_00680 [Candidatus Woesebacteria bacterium RIFCSPHIGHO2_01_FULL_39_95]OGM34126.1 MAG: hypothetical protein A3D01_00135 [Candidatus Woesebacteria bacterium RIFCSPHIGHO2_02_FULL_39_13]OGM38725.1 MAG: hypothetical protein A3E13_03870 [Candidatus Woesebacteria bacterium RIFCSPHIGHO2_12_FULL_40_20]OGM67586.1 MAG: hypothetical protein A2962_03550 [Candidatus Woesebacteria bacterium RIFCSPLOWO2_01_FULL_39_61]OGM75433.1 MAG: hypothetical protein A3H19_03600 [Candidatus
MQINPVNIGRSRSLVLKLIYKPKCFYHPSQKTMVVNPWMNAKNFLHTVRNFAPDEAVRRRYTGFQPGGLHFLISKT